MANINKYGVGQLNSVYDPSNGKTYERAEFLFMKLGEQIVFVHPVYDDLHFLYQRHIPLSEEELIRKYNGIMPKEMMGPNILCTCGSEGVYMLEGPYAGYAICKSVATLDKHQTSFKIKDGRLIVDKKTADNKLMTDAEINKLLKTEEERKL